MKTQYTSPARKRLSGAGDSAGRGSTGRGSAEQHRRTRQARAGELAEDYVEVIGDLIIECGEARVVDIARRLGVTHVTVTRTVSRLRKQGLVRAERYRSIFLSEDGQKLASWVRKRHEVVLEFLLALGIDEQIAQVDAEGIEHHVSHETVQAFTRFCNRQRGAKRRPRRKYG